ncbi:hypothetical protein MMC22_005558 [Lobaria immixta]|nr:hypothetical protein [Lobaria immixta]
MLQRLWQRPRATVSDNEFSTATSTSASSKTFPSGIKLLYNAENSVVEYREDDDTALIAARQRPENHLQNILHSTRGIIFLGTPHHGAGLAMWAEKLARSIGLLKQTSPQILAVLERDSEVLARIQDHFHTMIRSRNKDGFQPIEITCFYEELPLQGVGIVVPSQSAILPGYIPIGIRCNHIDMTRFEREDDPGFTAIAGELRRWIKEMIPQSNAGIHRVSALEQQQGRTFLVPRTSNPGFVGRVNILEKLKARLGPMLRPNGATFQARAALFGLGGIGKTQIALAYAYWVHVEYPEVSVFWVHASNAERFHQAFSQIAQSCEIPGYNDPKAKTLNLVKAWLERKDQRPWLMIIDSADDTNIFFNSGEAVPQKLDDPDRFPLEGTLGCYIPQCSHGAILVTTRNKQTGIKLTKGRGVIEVGGMDQAESSQLIHKILESDDLDPNHISILTSRLENLPLALTQATAFIQENILTITKYLELLDQGDNSLIELLSQSFEAEGRDWSIPNAVTATWIISFKQIKEQYPYASDLLSLMSFFDRQEIPKIFLSHYIEQGSYQEVYQQEQKGQANRLLELEKALGILKAFSFVLEGKEDENLSVHRLIQLVMRKWLMTEGRFGEWAGKALLTVSDIYPFGRYESRRICGDYLPHAYAVLSYEGLLSTSEVVAKAGLLHCTAGFMHIQGQWDKAEELLLQAVGMRKTVFGSEHPSSLNSMAGLASTYRNQGRWDEAEKLEVQVMETRLKVLKAEHPATLTSMANLASTYRNQGRWDEAEKLEVQVMETSLKVLKAEHPDTLTSMANLAYTYHSQNRHHEAIELMKKVIDLRTKSVGPNHPDTLDSIDLLKEWSDA